MHTTLARRAMRAALAAGFVDAGLPALASVPSLAEALARIDAEPASAYLGQPGMQVRDAHELARMKAYLQAHYAGVVARHHFELAPGRVFDCVDELTQPGARRLGLTRESWVSRPSQVPLEPAPPASGSQASQQALDRHARDPGIFLKPAHAEADADGHAKSCAQGTIPMRRLDLARLAAFQTLEHFRHKRGQPGQRLAAGQAPDSSEHQWAKAYQYVSNWGAESTLNIWKAYTEKASEFSLSQIWAVGGDGDGLQTVEAGWQVYRNRHLGSHPKDAHLFIYSTQDNYTDTGCYDLECDDFVQTNSDVAIGGYFTKQSQVDGPQYVTTIQVLKDHEGGDWWIKVGGVYAGYYPRSLYNAAGIRDQAAKVTFGGEIVNTWPSGRHTMTDMGSGYKPSAGFGFATYQRTIRYVDLNYAFHTPSLTEFRSDAGCYDVDSAYASGSWKTYIYFGGEGYGSDCP